MGDGRDALFDAVIYPHRNLGGAGFVISTTTITPVEAVA